MEFLVVTNNPQVKKKYNNLMMISLEGSVEELFDLVRDYIHRGHRLLTHPLSGSLKPGRIPYKTILISVTPAGLDPDSLRLIEGAIEACSKFARNKCPQLPGQVLSDYAAVDLAHLEAALEN